MIATRAVSQRQVSGATFSDRPWRLLPLHDYSLALQSRCTLRARTRRRQQYVAWRASMQSTVLKHVGDWTFYRTPSASGRAGKLPTMENRHLMKASQLRIARGVLTARWQIIRALGGAEQPARAHRGPPPPANRGGTLFDCLNRNIGTCSNRRGRN